MMLFQLCSLPARAAKASITTTSSHEERFIGSEACGQCHSDALAQWQGSHHDWAMKPATASFVLGNFNGQTFDHFGVKTHFFKKGEQFWVTTENAQGKPESYPIAYTFGVFPLQQYLIAFPGGRYQALTVAWDSRPKSEGGQRWFHLYPNEAIPAGDSLHWTGPYFNWNGQCADCHSTGLTKGFDPATERFNTEWAEINVGCESCHGPGEDHQRWASECLAEGEAKTVSGKFCQSIETTKGWTYNLASSAQWFSSPSHSTLQSVKKASVKTESTSISIGDAQITVCARCHSRRRSIGDIKHAEAGFTDQFELQLLEQPHYHIDGQIKDEVYVLGSFLQSKMYHRGVVCSDCHNPHSLELHASGNAVCTRCHNPDVFDTQTHHHHPDNSAGAQCVDCHMPETTYMVVDPRRDHSLRIPRPDLSVRNGAPNACVQCHSGQSNRWATDVMSRWLRTQDKTLPDRYHGDVLSRPEIDVRALIDLAQNKAQPDIVRASVLVNPRLRSASESSQAAVELARKQLTDTSPLVRRAAVLLLESFPPAQRLVLLRPHFNETVKSVRMAMAQVLGGIPLAGLDSADKAALTALDKEFLQSLRYGSNSPVGKLALGNYYVQRGLWKQAQASFQKALEADKGLVIAAVNLADVYRHWGQEERAESTLREVLSADRSGAAHHSLGLSLVRQKRYSEALRRLSQAADLDKMNVQFGYVYAIALSSLGQIEPAIAHLEALDKRVPQQLNVLTALLSFYQRTQQRGPALKTLNKLKQLQPDNPRWH